MFKVTAYPLPLFLHKLYLSVCYWGCLNMEESSSIMLSEPESAYWQLRYKKLKPRIAHLLQYGPWLDCMFVVGAQPHQEMVGAHKLILAIASPIFEAMVYGRMAEGHEQIRILDMRPEAFKALLEYIYTDKIRIGSFDLACELWYGGKKYMLPHLVRECTQYLWAKMCPANACRGYEFARLFQENAFKEKCLQVIRTKTKEVLAESSFEKSDLATVVELLSMDQLNVDSELDLFEAVVRYAQARDSRWLAAHAQPPDTSSPKPSTSDEKLMVMEISPEPEACRAAPVAGPSGHNAAFALEIRENLTIRNAIEKIRFLTLSPQQFAEGPARSPLLAESEAFAVLMRISSSRSHVPLPRGFSMSREPRKLPTCTVAPHISIGKWFINYINKQFNDRNLLRWVGSLFHCSHCDHLEKIMKRNFAVHFVCHCPGFNQQRADYEMVCGAFDVNPYSIQVKKNKDATEALIVFIEYIQRQIKRITY